MQKAGTHVGASCWCPVLEPHVDVSCLEPHVCNTMWMPCAGASCLNPVLVPQLHVLCWNPMFGTLHLCPVLVPHVGAVFGTPCLEPCICALCWCHVWNLCWCSCGCFRFEPCVGAPCLEPHVSARVPAHGFLVFVFHVGTPLFQTSCLEPLDGPCVDSLSSCLMVVPVLVLRVGTLCLEPCAGIQCLEPCVGAHIWNSLCNGLLVPCV